LTRRDDIFLIKGEKIEKFGIFRGIFPNPKSNQRWLTQPGSKNFEPDPSLIKTLISQVLDKNSKSGG